MNLYMYLFNLEIAFCACPANVLCVSENEPSVVKTIPKYLKRLTISNGSLSYVNAKFRGNMPPFLKIKIFVFETLTLSFYLAEYSDKTSYRG